MDAVSATIFSMCEYGVAEVSGEKEKRITERVSLYLYIADMKGPLRSERSSGALPMQRSRQSTTTPRNTEQGSADIQERIGPQEQLNISPSC